MKKSGMTLAAAALISISTLAYAETTTAAPAIKTETKTQTVESKQAANSIKLYADPSETAKVIATIETSTRLVPFYQKGEWIKVGNPADGATGWINKDEYRKAMEAKFHQHIQMMYVDQSEDGSGKPQITVYQNGKKLTGEEAQAVYDAMRKQQDIMQQRMRILRKDMNQMTNDWMMPAMPMMQPIIIIEKNKPGAPSTETPKATETKPNVKNN